MDCFVASLLAMTKKPNVFHNATLSVREAEPAGSRLSFGTVPERIAPESVTPSNSRYVHRNIQRR